VSASQGTTPRTGTMSSRDLRAARAARSARSTSPVKHRPSTLKNGTQAPPLQTRSLLTFQTSTDDLENGRAAREAHQHTLPTVSRKKSQAASAETQKSAVDDFHCEYDYARQLGSDGNVTATPDDTNNDDFAMFRRDNLSQDSYRVSDSRDSSVDRLEIRTKADVDVEFIGGEPLDEAKLIEKLQQEQLLQEHRMTEEQTVADWTADDVDRNVEKQLSNGDDVHVIKAEWDLPESCLQTEVEKIVSIETTRIVETVETTRVAPKSETYRRQKRLSRENAVRVVDEDVIDSSVESETCAVDTSSTAELESVVPVSRDQDEAEHVEATYREEIKLFVASIIDDAIRMTAEERKAAAVDEEAEVEEQNVTFVEKSESAGNFTSPVTELPENTLEIAVDETVIPTDNRCKPEAESELAEDKEMELNGHVSEDTAESQVTVVEIETSDIEQESDGIADKILDEPQDKVTRVSEEEAALYSPTDAAGTSQEVKETVESPNDACIEDAVPSAAFQDSLQSSSATEGLAEEAVVSETEEASKEMIQSAVDQTLTSSETEKQQTQNIDSDDVCQETVVESEHLPDESAELCKDIVPEPAAETSEDIPYVLHKRHIVSAAQKTTGDTRFYTTLPTRRHTSRSRSLSPGHKMPVTLTIEQKRAQLMKIKANLVSMAAEMGARRSPKSPLGASAPPTKRVFDFVVCSRLPPRDSFSSRDDTLSPPDKHDITLASKDKKIQPTDTKPVREPDIESSQLPEFVTAELPEKADDTELQRAKDSTEEYSVSELLQSVADFPSVEIRADVSLNTVELEETIGAEVQKLQTPEGVESESESDSKPIGDEAATPELEDEVNQILSECELYVAAEDDASLASGVSGKFTDESPEVESRRTHVTLPEGAVSSEHRDSIPSSAPDVECLKTAAELSGEGPGTDVEDRATGAATEMEIQPPITRSSEQTVESTAVDESVNGVVTLQSGDVDVDSRQRETGAMTRGELIAYNAAELAAAEQRLLLELQTNDVAAAPDNISSSSHSLNDQLDAEVLQSCSTMPQSVDAACRLSESSVDGSATCGFGRNVHLLDWLEEQAQLRGVTVSPHDADGQRDVNISDEDDVEHAVFDDNLQDIFAALEAEVMANPFLVPVTPQTSDMTCVNAMTSERFSYEDDSSCGVLEASGGVVESTYAIDSCHKEVLTLSDRGSKEIGAVGITAEAAGNIRHHSQLSLSISSEGDVVIEHVNDLPDPLEVLELESKALPPQLRDSKPLCLSSGSESLSDECREEDKLQDVGDVLDRVDEDHRLSISDLADEEHLLAAGEHLVPLASDTSSGSSVRPVCVEEEADVFAGVDEAGDLTGDVVDQRHSNSDEDAQSVSTSSAVDSDPPVLGNFVEQVMLHHSAGSELFDGDDPTTAPDVPTASVVDRLQLHAADENTAQSEYTPTPSCETDNSTIVAQQLLRLPEGAEAFSDTAISDEDEVERGIEGSLRDVFAALEAELETKQFPVPLTPPTPLVIGHDSSSDDEEPSSDMASKTASYEQQPPSAEFTEAAADDVVMNVCSRTEETLRVTDERISDENCREEAADADVDADQSPTGSDVRKTADAAALEEPLAKSSDDWEDDAVDYLTADRHCFQDKHDETRTTEQTVEDTGVEQESSRKESDATQTLRDSVDVSEEAVERSSEGITETEIARRTETVECGSNYAEDVNVGDTADENVPVERHGDDGGWVNTAADAGEDSSVQKSVEDESFEAATEAHAVDWDNRIALETSPELAAEDVEDQSEEITDVTESV